MSSDILIDASLLDFSKTCRLCLNEGTEFCQLFTDKETADTSITSLPSKIMACLSIEVSPENNTPKQICWKCMQQIDAWVKFKELCDSANALLHQCLANLQATAEDAETLRINLQGATSAIPDTLSEMDVSIFERDSLFGGMEDGSQGDVWLMPDDLNVSLPDSILNQKLEPNRLSETMPPADNAVLKTLVEVPQTKPEVKSTKWKEKYENCYQKTYACDICPKTFSKFVLLLGHDRKFHADRLTDFSCTVCGQLFVSQSRVDVHMLKHWERTAECTVCQKMFLNQKSLSVHMVRHNGRFVCETCGAVKGSSRILQDHVRARHSGERPFACQLCGKSFTTQQGRDLHQRRHLGPPLDFKCDVCGCLRRSLAALNSHKQTHAADKSFICDFCGKSFKTEITFHGHLKVHSDVKPHKCLVCSASFNQRYLLVRHEAMHLNLSPFSCYICDKSFKRKSSLTEHIRIHTGEKRYSCAQCLTAYSRLRGLKKHKCVANSVDNTTDTGSSDNQVNANSVSALPFDYVSQVCQVVFS